MTIKEVWTEVYRMIRLTLAEKFLYWALCIIPPGIEQEQLAKMAKEYVFRTIQTPSAKVKR